MKNGFKTQLKARLEKSFTDVNDLETISLENRNHVSAMITTMLAIEAKTVGVCVIEMKPKEFIRVAIVFSENKTQEAFTF